MQAFDTYRGIIVAMNRANVDTDQIIPKQFLKSIKRTGFEEGLFFDWRYRPDGSLDPDFEMNHPHAKGAGILLVRNNFGCGSSREHAVWAVVQAGIRVIIAPWRDVEGGRIPGFADIFANNAVKNGLLTIQLPENVVDELFERVAAHPGVAASVDLEKQTLTVHDDSGQTIGFEVDATVKNNLLKGLDPIAQTLENEAEISDFEKRHDPQLSAK